MIARLTDLSELLAAKAAVRSPDAPRPSMWIVKARFDLWLAERGAARGPVDLDAHELDEEGYNDCVIVYLGVPGGTAWGVFRLPPGWEYDRDAIEEFFAAGRLTYAQIHGW
jgi:hypothetical protein